MLTVQITTSQKTFRLPVEQIEFVVHCKHDHEEFLTIDPDKQYCSMKCRKAAEWKRTLIGPTRPSRFVDLSALKHA